MSYPFRTIRTEFWSVDAKVGRAEEDCGEGIVVTDISAGGLQFHAQKQYEKGDVLCFCLKIIAPFLAKDTEIVIKEMGVIRWSKDDENGHSFGAEFTEITEFTRSLIMSLIQRTVYVFGDEYMHTMFR